MLKKLNHVTVSVGIMLLASMWFMYRVALAALLVGVPYTALGYLVKVVVNAVTGSSFDIWMGIVVVFFVHSIAKLMKSEPKKEKGDLL